MKLVNIYIRWCQTMLIKLDESQVGEVLPQKYPFRFIKAVERLDVENKSILAEQIYPHDEAFFKGHFPGDPVVPGVLLIESMAQAALILLSKTLEIELNQAYLVKVKDATFYKPVVPDQKVWIQNVELISKGKFWEVGMQVKSDTGKKIAKSKLILQAGG